MSKLIIVSEELKCNAYFAHCQCYYTIIQYSYLSRDKHSNEEIMRKVALEKTSFYERKNEAIAIMGIALWGYALPTLLKEISDEKSKGEQR